MNNRKKRILSFLLASVILNSANNVEANSSDCLIQEEVIQIDSDNIKNYIIKNYEINSLDSINVKVIDSLTLDSFKLSDLNELYKFPNLKYLYLTNGYISDSSFLSKLSSLKTLYLYNCKVDELKFLKDIKISDLSISECDITKETVSFFPSTLKKLRLVRERMINDLSHISDYCPNMKSLYLSYCSGIVNLDFIYKLENLEEISILETAGCNEDLLNYINSKGILTNLSVDDVDNNRKINQILNSIINDNMTEREKVQAISIFIKSNMKRVMFDNNSSNIKPLSTILENNKGTYISFAYLANSLFNIAGLDSYILKNNNYYWNLVEVDNKYYYNDTSERLFSFLIDWFDIGFYYMQDPSDVLISKMKELEDIPLSEDLKEDIISANEKKSIYEKYLSNLAVEILFISLMLYVLNYLCKRENNKEKKLKK